jgi:hypothetical protein
LLIPLPVETARRHRQVSIRSTISSSNSITISRLANQSGQNRWTTLAHKWCLNKAVELSETMCGMEVTATTFSRHRLHKLEKEVHREVAWLERLITTLPSLSTRIKCDIQLIICLKLTQVIIIITRLDRRKFELKTFLGNVSQERIQKYVELRPQNTYI